MLGVSNVERRRCSCSTRKLEAFLWVKRVAALEEKPGDGRVRGGIRDEKMG
jgi:hypothetical protein